MKVISVSSTRALEGLLVATLMCFGCARSPEAKSARYIETGKKLLQQKDVPRALLQFRNAVQVTPKSAEAHYQLGLAYMEASDPRNGYASFRRVLELDPKHKAAQLHVAQMMSMSNDPALLKDAQQRLQALLQDNADDATGLHTLPAADVLSALAVAELRLGNLDDAAVTLERVLASAPRELTASILLARAKLAQKDEKGAEEVLKKACEAAPKSAEARVVLGQLYLSQRRLPAAEEEFKKAVELNSESAIALNNLARLQMFAGRSEDAEKSFRRLSELSNTTYKWNYAYFLLRQGRRDESLREFERVASANPDDRLARTRLVAAYYSFGRPQDAEKLLNGALKKNANDIDALLQKGELLIRTGKFAEAEASLNNVLRLKPDSGEAHYVVGRMFQARGANYRDRQELTGALRLNPNLLQARLEMVESLLASKDVRAASEVLAATPKDQMTSPQIQVQRNWIAFANGDMTEMRKGIDAGLASERSLDLLVQDGLWKLRAGNPQGARVSLEEALKINPSDTRALRGLRAAYNAQKQPGAAIQKVKEYASQNPKSAALQEFLGAMLERSGDHQQARAAFAAAKAADPASLNPDLSLATVDMVEGKWDDASARLSTVLARDPSNPTVNLWVGNVEAVRGKRDAAIDHFRRVLEAWPDNHESLNNLAYLLAERGSDYDQALKYAQRAQELSPEDKTYSDTLGWILYRKGLYSSAIPYLERAATASDSPSTGMYHLAMAYAKAGQSGRAKQTLDAALKLAPNAPEARQASDVVGGTH